jgi:hypothetical protein
MHHHPDHDTDHAQRSHEGEADKATFEKIHLIHGAGPIWLGGLTRLRAWQTTKKPRRRLTPTAIPEQNKKSGSQIPPVFL